MSDGICPECGEVADLLSCECCGNKACDGCGEDYRLTPDGVWLCETCRVELAKEDSR